MGKLSDNYAKTVSGKNLSDTYFTSRGVDPKEIDKRNQEAARVNNVNARFQTAQGLSQGFYDQANTPLARFSMAVPEVNGFGDALNKVFIQGPKALGKMFIEPSQKLGQFLGEASASKTYLNAIEENKKSIDLWRTIAKNNPEKKEQASQKIAKLMESIADLANQTGGELKNQTDTQLAGLSLQVALDFGLPLTSFVERLGTKAVTSILPRLSSGMASRGIPNVAAKIGEFGGTGALYGGAQAARDETNISEGATTGALFGLGTLGAGFLAKKGAGAISKVFSKEGEKVASTVEKVAPKSEPITVYRGQPVGGEHPTGAKSYTTDKTLAEKYAKLNEDATGKSEVVSEDIANKKIKEVSQKEFLDASEDPALRKEYDGLKFTKEGESQPTYVLFDKPKTVEEKVPVPKETVPIKTEEPPKTEFKPTEGQSKVIERANEILPEEFKVDGRYTKIQIKNELHKAAKMFDEDPKGLMKLAMGRTKSNELTQNAASTYLFSAAVEKKEYAVAAKIAKATGLRATRQGQEIAVLAANAKGNKQHAYMQKLIQFKLAHGNLTESLQEKLSAALERVKGTRPNRSKIVQEAINTETKVLKKQLTGKKLDLSNAQSLIDKLAC